MTRFPHRRFLLVAALGSAATLAHAQVAMTGAINFSTDSTGAASGGQVWDTLGSESHFAFWLARNSAFGPTNSPSFVADRNNTLTLTGAAVAGSGRTYYSSDGVTVVLTGYEWNSPLEKSPDVCQAYVFAPGNGPDFFGSFTLQVFPAAALTVTPDVDSPGTPVIFTGNRFEPLETIDIYLQQSGGQPRYTTTADSSGAFNLAALEAQVPHGYQQYLAVGQSSRKLGAATVFISPGVSFSPNTGVAGSTTSAEGVGFGAGEDVQIYWNEPRQLLGTALADSRGRFTSGNGVKIKVPLDAPKGINNVIGVGETTKAIGLGSFTVESTFAIYKTPRNKGSG